LPLVLRALKQLLPSFPNLRLQILGKNQNLGKMQHLAQKLEIQEHVDFLGWVPPDRVNDYFRRAAVFVMPSLMEGFGLVFLEAMAAGLPVIGGNVGGTRELIEDGVNGILVEPLDERALAKKIKIILKGESVRHQFISAGSTTFQQFESSRTITDTIRFYQAVART